MPAPSPPLNVLLVDDHELVRFGMASLLRGADLRNGIGLILEAGSLEEARALVNANRIDLALVDLGLSDSDGLDTLARLRALCGEVPLAVVTGSRDVPVPARLRALGADAWFVKSDGLEPLLDWIRGRIASTRASGAETVADLPAPYRAIAERLTAQQRAVLEQVLAGEPNSRIAERTGLSIGTVKNYVSLLLGLFDADSRAQLIARLRG